MQQEHTGKYFQSKTWGSCNSVPASDQIINEGCGFQSDFDLIHLPFGTLALVISHHAQCQVGCAERL
jgi:hypothetical protein